MGASRRWSGWRRCSRRGATRHAWRWACTSRWSAPRTCRAWPTRDRPAGRDFGTELAALLPARLRRLAARRGAGRLLFDAAERRAGAGAERRRSIRRRRRATARRVVEALGPMARHVVVANAGHGLIGIGCLARRALPLHRRRRRSGRAGGRCGLRGGHSAAAGVRADRGGVRAGGAMIEVDGRGQAFRRRRRARPSESSGGRAWRARRRPRRSCRPCATSPSPPPTAASPACSGRTAPARRPRCACWPA